MASTGLSSDTRAAGRFQPAASSQQLHARCGAALCLRCLQGLWTGISRNVAADMLPTSIVPLPAFCVAFVFPFPSMYLLQPSLFPTYALARPSTVSLAPQMTLNEGSEVTVISIALVFESVSTPRFLPCGLRPTSYSLKRKSCATPLASSALHCSWLR